MPEDYLWGDALWVDEASGQRWRCIVCGATFDFYPGVGKPRRTCPAPSPCAELLADATRALKSPPSLSKQLRRISGYRFLHPLDD